MTRDVGLVRDEQQSFLVTLAHRRQRQLRELATQEIGRTAHLLGGVRALLPGRPAAARDTNGAHRDRHEQRQDHDRDQ
jgi:hypothetical protein